MAIWRCEFCSRELESELEPESCPCGSDMIGREEKKSQLEKIIENLKNSNKAQS